MLSERMRMRFHCVPFGNWIDHLKNGISQKAPRIKSSDIENIKSNTRHSPCMRMYILAESWSNIFNRKT